jgi:hypothetical protein
MKEKIVNLTLPEFAFVSGYDGPGDTLQGRTVILHVRTATVMEVFSSSEVCLASETPHYDYIRHAPFFDEPLTIALHYSATIDDKDELLKVLHRTADWYNDYCDWEDLEILTNEPPTQS